MTKKLSVRKSTLAGAIFVLAALTLTACFPFANMSPRPSENSAAFSTAEAYYAQTAQWSDCGSGAQCATVFAPLDWDNISATDAVALKLTRHTATGSNRLGSVFINPGGPGASGANFVADSVDSAASKRLQEHYDVIGWDPRGVNGSDRVTCYDAAGMDTYIFGLAESAPRTDAWIEEMRTSSKAFGEECLAQTGDLLAHVDTISTAHDLDMLRAIVGDEKLNYVGYSYGTLIGAYYAQSFATNVGRMVLDGVVDPNVTTSEMILFQTQGFEAALSSYLEWCIQQNDCPFSGTVEQAKSSISQLLAKVEANPLQGADGRMLGVNTLLIAIIYPLYSEDSWPYLTDLFNELRSGGTETAFLLADSYFSRDSDGTYLDNSNEAFSAINCIDYARETDYATMKANAEKIAQAAPVFGKYQGYGELACMDWPVEPKVLEGELTASGAPPILVIGTTGDPATPYQWAVNLAGTLESGVMITYNGEGHTAYNRSNDCVLDTVDNYMISGTVPTADPQC